MDNDLYISSIPSAHWKSIEYEYATCSECGFNEYTGWDSTNQAKKEIRNFHLTYRYCPGCGRKMGATDERGKN